MIALYERTVDRVRLRLETVASQHGVTLAAAGITHAFCGNGLAIMSAGGSVKRKHVTLITMKILNAWFIQPPLYMTCSRSISWVAAGICRIMENLSNTSFRCWCSIKCYCHLNCLESIMQIIRVLNIPKLGSK